MIKEIVDEIKKAEADAEQIKQKARETGGDIIRQSAKKADHIKNSIHKDRKGIIRNKIEDSEKKAQKESRKILKEAEVEADRMENKARRNLEEAVKMVYERVTGYGN